MIPALQGQDKNIIRQICYDPATAQRVIDLLGAIGSLAASDISNDSTVSGTTVKDALNWLKTNIAAGSVVTVTGNQVDNTDPANPIIRLALKVATVAPTVTDDSAHGNFVTQMWLNSVTGILYRAASVGVGAASWVVIYNPATGGGGFNSVNVDAAANFAAGVLTLPAGTDAFNVIVLTTAAGGNITKIAGAIPSTSTFQMKCAAGIVNTLETSLIAGVAPPAAGSIISNAGNFVINGDHLDNVTLQLDSTMIVHVSDSINI